MALSCDLIRDLIPLVKGRNASGESVRRVEEHLADCDACAQFYESCTPDKEKRSIRLVMFFLKLLTVGTLVFLSQWILKGFWSSFFLAASGAVTYFAFRRGRWILPLGVLACAFATPLIDIWQRNGQYALKYFFPFLFTNFIYYILFPVSLVLGGMAAAFLIHFTLRPRHRGDPLPTLLKWTSFINRSSPALRISAGALAVAVAAAGFIWVNSVYGNPVSSLVAENAMRTYLHEKYSSYDLTYGDTRYLGGSYLAEVSSPTIADLSFALTYYSDGKVTDTYLSRVASGTNTFERLEGEMGVKLTSILKTKFGSSLLQASTSPLDSVPMLREKVLGGLTSFGTAETPYFAIDIVMNLSDFTPETAAAKITQCYNALNEKGYVFRQYSISTSNGPVLGVFSGITPEDIQSGNLISLLTAATLGKSEGSHIDYSKP